jgi:hypothetical protein
MPTGLLDAPGEGDRGVGQIRGERGPDAFDRVVVEAVGGGVARRDDGRRRVDVGHRRRYRYESGGATPGEASGCRRPDPGRRRGWRAGWRRESSPGAAGAAGPDGADGGQPVQVPFAFGQQDRSGRQVGEAPADARDDAVGVASGGGGVRPRRLGCAAPGCGRLPSDGPDAPCSSEAARSASHRAGDPLTRDGGGSMSACGDHAIAIGSVFSCRRRRTLRSEAPCLPMPDDVSRETSGVRVPCSILRTAASTNPLCAAMSVPSRCQTWRLSCLRVQGGWMARLATKPALHSDGFT